MARDLKIDHVTVCGSDLGRMRRVFAEIGIPTEYGGAHGNGLTHMAMAGFGDGSYLELIAPVDGADPAKATGMIAGWMPLMVGNAGAGAWAIQVAGIQDRAEELRSRGIEVRGPERGGRLKPDGTRLEWETAGVGPGAAGSVFPFMIEDRTARGLRVKTSSNELGVDGVAAVVIGVHDLPAASARFQRAYGWADGSVEQHADFGARLAWFAGTPVILAEAIASGEWLGERLARFGEGPAAFLFSSRQVDVAQETTWFGRGVEWSHEERIGTRVGFVAEKR
jgi:hypothetical protein